MCVTMSLVLHMPQWMCVCVWVCGKNVCDNDDDVENIVYCCPYYCCYIFTIFYARMNFNSFDVWRASLRIPCVRPGIFFYMPRAQKYATIQCLCFYRPLPRYLLKVSQYLYYMPSKWCIFCRAFFKYWLADYEVVWVGGCVCVSEWALCVDYLLFALLLGWNCQSA